jgi:uncharacterized protein (DUF433 family)
VQYRLPARAWENCPAAESDQEKLGGEWIFKGTRVPLRALFENLESGASINDFLEWFPGVKPEQAKAVLLFAHHDGEGSG